MATSIENMRDRLDQCDQAGSEGLKPADAIRFHGLIGAARAVLAIMDQRLWDEDTQAMLEQHFRAYVTTLFGIVTTSPGSSFYKAHKTDGRLRTCD